MLSYEWYKECCRKLCKIAVTSALVDMNVLTVITINRNSLKYDVLSLQVHSYYLLHKEHSIFEEISLSFIHTNSCTFSHNHALVF